jgi:hypothetical protein
MADEGLFGVPMSFSPRDTLTGSLAAGLGAGTGQMITPYTSTGAAAGIGLGSILLQSLLGYQARQQAAERTLELNRLSSSLLSMQTPQERADYIGTLGDVDPLVLGRLGSLSGALTAQDIQQQRALAQKRSEMMLEQELGTSAKGKELALIKQGIIPADTGMATGQAAPIQPTENPFGDFETLQQKRDRLIDQGARKGITPGKRLEYANKALKFEESSLEAARKNLIKLRDAINDSEELIATAKRGMEGAGETGGPGYLQRARELASGAYSLLPTPGGKEELEQRAATKDLDSIRPKIVRSLRSPGAVSNYETEILIGAGPSSQNTPQENARLIANMERIKELNADYADFLEAYVEAKGDAVGADKIWRNYKNDEVFRDGKFNDARMDWKEYFRSTKAGTYEASDQGKTDKAAVLQQMKDELKAVMERINQKKLARGQ